MVMASVPCASASSRRSTSALASASRASGRLARRTGWGRRGPPRRPPFVARVLIAMPSSIRFAATPVSPAAARAAVRPAALVHGTIAERELAHAGLRPQRLRRRGELERELGGIEWRLQRLVAQAVQQILVAIQADGRAERALRKLRDDDRLLAHARRHTAVRLG